MTTEIRSSADGSKSYISVGDVDRIVIDAATGAVGIGTNPAAWHAVQRVVQVGYGSLWGASNAGVTHLTTNAYFDGANYKAFITGNASDHYQLAGTHVWRTAIGVTAGANVTSWVTCAELDAAGNFLLKSGTGGLGYGIGAGGTVTQATSKSTAVTLNKPTGQITMNAASLAAGGLVSFTLNNSLFASTDTVSVQLAGGFASFSTYRLYAITRGAGQIEIMVENRSGSAAAEAIVIQFEIRKGATA